MIYSNSLSFNASSLSCLIINSEKRVWKTDNPTHCASADHNHINFGIRLPSTLHYIPCKYSELEDYVTHYITVLALSNDTQSSQVEGLNITERETFEVCLFALPGIELPSSYLHDLLSFDQTWNRLRSSKAEGKYWTGTL